ncbi:bifunctional diaminohydroxyphosphoribosylaminopyrimidine deaminase/5-amino-6-(5-phosphoribosylamino)uracil reductase RibD [Thauera linaloolentis]|uniref:Riboflavin biosynthesis protein RibD n=1 Tax=Thauera linaloolentis (strain DSM 12138 / JCM 21573 / CCUG 41526 / CIP 105981 / IAM 15112 / NBRC 102519 / 47Lol) TaxID=1123367 RepID=N6XWU0_THAL4|nr:bifunctional diaminohydroxyphosphoribosylaminopyrimidine deaminase/5-amino-6-(5-phosphoribosylamino)uracil reductase RibD [Thauera linaloolentis]ENO83755.1 riboflavin biosynthesis protein RibD [Thauera linaloolentis 47Lol = DSM 12138]MCM8563998.1 bifunctional diaminohydroxyphosphoribosylaminopyrimidine deaminase/5-amino-6-(5-phosphoribosylamino)uracil reductase RibD [Thauera linaloolentis]
MTFSAADHAAMARALQLAALGLNTTSPNPRVGCVLSQNGAIIAEGWHRRAGEPHAEIHALRQAGGAARGATAYVTLEPCSHFGRTPPCADALIDAGVARVVAAMEDPNPLVAGRGMARLRAAGIVTEHGLLETEARELNIGFVSRMTRGRPWLRLKAAATLDGKTALENGVSQWITGPEARRDGHAWRARACAVLTGVGTVKADDPQLNVREAACERQPLRILIDARLEAPPAARILQGEPILIATACEDGPRIASLSAAGHRLIVLPNAAGKVDLPRLLAELGTLGLNEIHAEAGFKLNGSLLREGCVDELLLYLAPLLAGDAAHGLFNLAALTRLEDATRLDIRDLRQLGRDIRILARIARG